MPRLLVILAIPNRVASLLPGLPIVLGLFGFALLERDGLVALAGAGIVSAALVSGVAFAFFSAAGHTVRQPGFTGG